MMAICGFISQINKEKQPISAYFVAQVDMKWTFVLFIESVERIVLTASKYILLSKHWVENMSFSADLRFLRPPDRYLITVCNQ